VRRRGTRAGPAHARTADPLPAGISARSSSASSSNSSANASRSPAAVYAKVPGSSFSREPQLRVHGDFADAERNRAGDVGSDVPEAP
jgi:hypothetical protein